MNEKIVSSNSNNTIIYKSNQLIESSYNLTTAENRLIYLAMTKLNTIILEKNLNLDEVEKRIKQAQFDLIFISVLDYKNTFNIKSNSLYSELAKIATQLYEEEVLYIKEDGDFGRKRWVTTCEYSSEGKGIALEFHPRMIKDLLIFRTEYTGMLFEGFVNKLKGKYSFRVYELAKQYLKIGKRDFEIEDLRFKLCLLDNEYSEYRDFKRMINNSIKEINKCADIKLEYIELEKIKSTKRVTKIRLIISPQNQQLDLFDENINENASSTTQNQVKILSELIGCKISAQQSRDLITTALTAIDKHIDLKEKNIGIKDYIKEKVEVCKDYTKIKGTEDYIGLLISALKGNWQKRVVIPPEPVKTEITNQPKQLRFNNFPARSFYDDEVAMDKLEKKLTSWADKYSTDDEE